MQIVIRDDSAFEGDVDTLLRTFKTNVAGPAHVSHAFLPLLEKGRKKTIVNISSTAGSIGADWSSIQTSYSISKTALNMLVRPYGFINSLGTESSRATSRRTSRPNRARTSL